MTQISPLAQVHPDAKIGKNVTILPFTFIDKDVTIGDNTWIASNVSIFEGARIGNNCRIFPGAVIAAVPQDLKFEGEYTTVEIGDNTTIRECVTVHRATKYAYRTTIGANCLIMAYAHVAHDCEVGNNVILANGVQLAGHVIVENHAILEGLVAVQQFNRIGEHAFVAGGSLVRKSIPPYIRVAREPLSYIGINSVGLERRGFSSETMQQIQNIYRHIFVAGYPLKKALDVVRQQEEPSTVREYILQFIENAKDGIVRGFHTSSPATTKITTNTDQIIEVNNNGQH